MGGGELGGGEIGGKRFGQAPRPTRQLQRRRGSALKSSGAKTMKLFEDGSEPADCVQGALGDCWLLSAFACLAENSQEIEALFLEREFVSREVARQGWHITDRHSPTHRGFSHDKFNTSTVLQGSDRNQGMSLRISGTGRESAADNESPDALVASELADGDSAASSSVRSGRKGSFIFQPSERAGWSGGGTLMERRASAFVVEEDSGAPLANGDTVKVVKPDSHVRGFLAQVTDANWGGGAMIKVGWEKNRRLPTWTKGMRSRSNETSTPAPTATLDPQPRPRAPLQPRGRTANPTTTPRPKGPGHPNPSKRPPRPPPRP